MILLIGAPGSGKGTQADLLVENRGFQKLSTGEALRRQIKLGSPVGLEAKKYVDAGKLVPDDTILNVLKTEMESLDRDKILLDGYPRNLEQAKTLKSLGDSFPIEAVIHLDLDISIVIERMTGRRVCGQCGDTYHIKFSPSEKEGVCDKCGGEVVHRSDDTLDKIKVRLEIYESKTKPLIDYYKKEGKYHRVEALGSVDDISGKVLTVLKS